jgi:hypothetical protein
MYYILLKMFHNKYHVSFKHNEVLIHKILIQKFINYYMKKYNDIEKAVIISKYYLYYKTLDCIYEDSIMKYLYDCDKN